MLFIKLITNQLTADSVTTRFPRRRDLVYRSFCRPSHRMVFCYQSVYRVYEEHC